MGKRKMKRAKMVNPQQIDVETVAEYITIDDLREKIIKESD